MLFRRRRPLTRWERLRVAVWPRRSFPRSARYFSRRVMRLTATPHAIAAGVGAGAFASFLPYVGFHFVIALVLAWVLRGNLIASALGTAIGNPLTFPLIWASCLAFGRTILYGNGLENGPPPQLSELLTQGNLFHLWTPIFLPMTVGGAVLGAACGAIFYVATWWAVSGFRARRRARLTDRARDRAAFPSGEATADA